MKNIVIALVLNRKISNVLFYDKLSLTVSLSNVNYKNSILLKIECLIYRIFLLVNDKKGNDL